MSRLNILALPLLGFGHFLSEAWTAARGETPHSDVPPMDPSLVTIVEAVLDRTFTLSVNLLAGVPSPSDVREAQRLISQAAETAERRGWLRDPAAFHPRPPRIDEWEEIESMGRQLMRPMRFKTLRFESGYQPHPSLERDRWNGYEENRDAYAYVLEHEPGPAGTPPRPWLVCIHGFSQGDVASGLMSFDARRFHEELGFNVLMPVLPLHGPRARGRSGGDVMHPDFVNMIHFFAQALWDIRRMLAWIRERGGDRIGVWGVSMGGYTTALLASFENDLECVISGIPPTDFCNVARDNMPWIMKSYEHEMSVDWNEVRQMMHVVSPLTFDPLIPRERRFIYAGVADRVVRPDQSRALWRRWDQPDIRWIPGGHVAMQFRKRTFDYVEEALGRSGLLAEGRAAA